MARPIKSDGFEEMINKDHAGAKESLRDGLADWLLDIRDSIRGGSLFLRHDALCEADDILKWLREGDTLEG